MSRSSFSRRTALQIGALAALSTVSGTAAQATPEGAASTPGATPPAGASPAASPAATPNPLAVTVPKVFSYGDFEFLYLIMLGETYEHAADVGECFATAARITDFDYDSWVDEWKAIADRIHGIAEKSNSQGHKVSAREAYLRAATYYSAAYFFSDGTKNPGQLVPNWEAHRASADAFFVRLDPPAEQVKIPYEGTTLPGYVLTVDTSGKPRPWLIMNNGSDGTITDMWAEGAAAALRRGYNVLIFDGPGQGAALFRQHLYFRPDWEKVITPIVDWLVKRSDVDDKRIAIMGISQGGYWVPRAVAFEHRIAAAIADPGVVAVSASFTPAVPGDALEPLKTLKGPALDQFKKEFDQGVEEEAAKVPILHYTLAFRGRPYGTTSFADVLLKTFTYNLNQDVIDKIACPMLIAEPQGEQFWPGQSQQLYDALKSPKQLAHFTAAEGADLHVEPKALALRSQVFFDWLDETLKV